MAFYKYSIPPGIDLIMFISLFLQTFNPAGIIIMFYYHIVIFFPMQDGLKNPTTDFIAIKNTGRCSIFVGSTFVETHRYK